MNPGRQAFVRSLEKCSFHSLPKPVDSGRRTDCRLFVRLTPCVISAAIGDMEQPDFNLLVTLDALLAEGSVAGAGRRLRLSPSAMSRALARLRESTGDP